MSEILRCRLSADLAELLPHPKASDPISNTAVAAVKAKLSAQQQHVAALQENSALLQQTTALLQQDSITLDSLRQSVADGHVDVKKISAQITDEHEDVKKISGQISKLIAKVDSLQNAITPEVTSSISTRHARYRLSRTGHKGWLGSLSTVGPVSLGGAPQVFQLPRQPHKAEGQRARRGASVPRSRTYLKKW